MEVANIVAIDLFSGAGGTTSGLKNAGIKVLGAVEIDSDACKTYRLNNPEVELIQEDIKKVESQRLLELLEDSKNDYFMLVACPPCQGFSSIGKRDSKDSRNDLVFQFLRLIIDLEPDFILMENVSGMISGKNKKTFNSFIDGLGSKYDTVFSVLNAADYGVPQNRKRLVLHGVKKELRGMDTNFRLELPKQSHAKNPEEREGILPWLDLRKVFDLPKISYNNEIHGFPNHNARKLSEINIKRIRYIREHGGSRSSLPESLQLDCHKKTKGHSDTYGIIDINKPAPTLTAGCLSYTKGRFGHAYEDRAISGREAARIQSFADTYIFVGGTESVSRQVGNAVPVKLAEASGVYFMQLVNRWESIKNG